MSKENNTQINQSGQNKREELIKQLKKITGGNYPQKDYTPWYLFATSTVLLALIGMLVWGIASDVIHIGSPTPDGSLETDVITLTRTKALGENIILDMAELAAPDSGQDYNIQVNYMDSVYSINSLEDVHKISTPLPFSDDVSVQIYRSVANGTPKDTLTLESGNRLIDVILNDSSIYINKILLIGKDQVSDSICLARPDSKDIDYYLGLVRKIAIKAHEKGMDEKKLPY